MFKLVFPEQSQRIATWEKLVQLQNGSSSRVALSMYGMPSMNGIPNSVDVFTIMDEHDEISTFRNQQLPEWIQCYSLRENLERKSKLTSHQVVELCSKWLAFMKELVPLIQQCECRPRASAVDKSYEDEQLDDEPQNQN